VIPELRLVRERSDILANSALAEEHPDAARDVLRALRIGARGLLELHPRLPKPVDVTDASIDEQFLLTLGGHIDSSLKERGLDWPPPRTEPPPSVAIDLIYLYQCATRQIFPVGVDGNLLLRDKLIKVAQQCDILLGQGNDPRRRVGAARRIAVGGNGHSPSKFGAFISGMGLAVSLIQGPGAMHDLPEDLVDFGGDVATVAGAVTSGISELLDEIAEAVFPFAE
jgi:hypothetical protein